VGIKTKILNVPIEKIFIDTNLEIKEIDPIYYKKLSAQIEQNGQLLPILVNYRKNEKKCYVIDGPTFIYWWITTIPINEN
jgi:ParB-like chromosome segregation protein Spo0J